MEKLGGHSLGPSNLSPRSLVFLSAHSCGEGLTVAGILAIFKVTIVECVQSLILGFKFGKVNFKQI